MEAKIEIKLYATLRKFISDESGVMEIESGSSIRDILGRLGIPANEAKLIFINGRKGTVNSILEGGERVGIFPPVGGG